MAASVAVHGARPRYGGTARIEVQGSIRALDPAAEPSDDVEASVRELVLPLLFETLVAIDPSGGLRPALAESWDGDAASARWRFALRSGVRLHDGSLLAAVHVVTALRARRPEWQIVAEGAAVVIDAGPAGLDLPWQLADLRHAIAVPTPAGDLIGTGPFRAERLERSQLLLRAHDAYWDSRPFVDAVRIEFDRPVAGQITSLETGRADLARVRQTDAARLTQRQLRVSTSRPREVFALVFEPHRAGAADLPLRRTLGMAVDRASMCRVLLQGHCEPAGALLPSWLSGYPPFVLQTVEAGLPRTAIAALPRERRSFTLRVTAGDSVAQAIADRIAVDARGAGFSMIVQAPVGLAPRADTRLVRVPVAVTSPERALARVMQTLGPRALASATREAAPAPGAPLDAVVRVERALLEQYVIVPVVHLPAMYATGNRVESFDGPVVLPSGAWNLANLWLRPDGLDRP